MVESNNILSRVDEGFFFSFFFFFKSGGRVLKELSQSQDIHFALWSKRKQMMLYFWNSSLIFHQEPVPIILESCSPI